MSALHLKADVGPSNLRVHALVRRPSSIQGLVLRGLEREQAGAQGGDAEHHHDDRIEKERLARAFATALPSLRQKDRAADAVYQNAKNGKHCPRQIKAHRLIPNAA